MVGCLGDDKFWELVALRTYWPILSYENLLEEESSDKMHGLLEAVGLALWCKIQL